MKKLKRFALLGFLMCIISIFVACGGKELSAPKGISIDEENRLSWTAVENARTYSIYIENVDTGETKESSSRKTNYSLSGLEEGDYIIKIKALAAGSQIKESDWSKSYEFHKDYETGCLYTLINNVEYEITRMGSASGDVFIEDVYRGKPVTRIADNAFKGSKQIENVSIGKNVSYIGDYAFYNCPALKSVQIPNSVESIGKSAFQSCRSLTDINLPAGLTQLKEATFAYCLSLEKIDLCSSNLITMEGSVFLDCSGLKEIVLPDTLKTLGEYAFSACTELTKVEISDSLTEIGDYAFYMCDKLEDLRFSDKNNLKSIGSYSFSQCNSLKAIDFPDGLEQINYAAFYCSENISEVSIPDSVNKVGAYAFADTSFYKQELKDGEKYVYADKWLVGCASDRKENLDVLSMADLREDVVGLADEVFANFVSLKTVELPQSVRFIGRYTFYHCTELYRVQTYNVESLGYGSFQECTSLQRLLFGEGLLEIGAYAFYGCTLLDNSTLAGSSSMIPSTVTKIGTYAFKNTKLWNNTPTNSVVYAGDWVVGVRGAPAITSNGIQEVYNIGSVTLEANTAGIADYAFFNVDSLMTVPNLHIVKKIGEGAFYGCTSLMNVVLNNNIKEIKDYTFYKCSKLLETNIPDQLQSIGRSAFYKCTSLTSVGQNGLLGAEVERIGDYAFYECSNLKSFALGKDLESIGNNAFYKCISLTNVALPNSLQQLGDKAYAYCENLTSVTFGEGLQEIGEYAFQSCTSLESVRIPDSVTKIEKYAFYKCTGLKEITFGASVEEIGEYAFMNVSNVESVVLPASLTTIKKYAFKGCQSLTSIVLQSDIIRIEDHAFYGCKQLTIYTNVVDKESVLWTSRWNSSYRPIVWGCTLSEDGTYVKSVKITSNTLSNERKLDFTAPTLEGYTFSGWATKENGAVEYTASEIVNVPEGTTVYAIWTKTGAETQDPNPSSEQIEE